MTELTLPTARDEAWRYADFGALAGLAPDAFERWREIAVAPGLSPGCGQSPPPPSGDA